MSPRGRYGKYGDTKRKELIRSTRVSRAGSAKALFTSTGATKEARPENRFKKKRPTR